MDRRRLPPISIPGDAYAAFEQLADDEKKSFSQAVRDALAEYAQKRGVEANFNVGEWGGDRRTKDTPPDA